MKQVAELVEERRDVGELHEPGVALDPARKVADQCGLGELEPRHAGADSELRGVVVFPGPRMEIEEEPAQELLALPDLVRLHAGIPHGRVLDLLVRHAEELRGDVEEALLDPLEGEVGARGLGVEIVVALLDQELVVPRFPSIDDRGAGVVLLLALQEDLVFALGLRPGQIPDPLDELGGVLPVADHLVGGYVIGPVAVSQHVGQPVSLRDHRVEDRHVRGIGAVQRLELEAAARLATLAIPHHREIVRVLDAERDLSVGARRVALHKVLGEPLEVRRRHLDLPRVIPDVAIEVLRDEHQLLAHRGDPLAHGIVLVHARQPEVAERLRDEVLRRGGGFGNINRLEGVVHRAVQLQLILELARLLRQRLGGRPKHRVGMHRLHQGGVAPGVVGVEHHEVVGIERVRDRPLALHREHLVQASLGRLELALA